MAAALSLGYCFHSKNRPISEFKNRCRPKNLILLSCQSREPTEEGTKKQKEKQTSLPFFVGFGKLGKCVKENLSPQKKGDWKDLTLMSLSFAVYVYISQKIVCAYFAWMSMPRTPW
ncbi:hypothetical protein FEM48_Zijuj05G0011800 [Ziziphus jujuba var. spinosa]|uniref:Uncharacterized protein n=1 Tax=Ziziphus jujuba var. spinosa TaxID=714518 RepID=A0A978VBX5_ZIZJJ|nr:hypothetical protein FEM48_Zijuj05G0011800 [Ziziphus jujuba var. spinosa]